MAEKNINARVQHKHDVEANWLKASGFVPKQGEIVVYDVDSTHTYERIKIGDGTTVVGSLPFVNDEIRQALTSGATKVSKAETADRATTADSATNAQTAQTAVSAQTANSATIADTALVANSATKATQDGNGKVIADTYETKADAVNKLNEAKAYTEQKVSNITNNFEQVISMMYGEDLPGEGMFPSIRSIAEDAVPQADWNENNSASGAYVKNRTHWIESGSNILQWDGNIEGRFTINYDNSNLCKVSDSVIGLKDLIGGKFYVSSHTEGQLITEDMLRSQTFENLTMHAVVSSDTIAVCVITDDYSNDGVTFEKGTYFYYIGEFACVNKLELTSNVFGEGTVHKIDPKFISIGGYGYDNSEILFDQTIELTDMDEMMGYIGTLPKALENKTYKITYNGTVYECVPSDPMGVGAPVVLGNASIFGGSDTGEPFMAAIMDEDGDGVIDFLFVDLNGATSASVKIEFVDFHTIDPKFLPKPDEDDALALLEEMELVQPALAADGSAYVDENGAFYSII